MLGLVLGFASASDNKRDLRRRLDRAISRALVDPEYATELLKRPQENLGTQEITGKYTTLQEG
jgi:hypothetical protein